MTVGLRGSATFDIVLRTAYKYSTGVNPMNPESVTLLLERWSQGDPTALERIIPLVYQELRSLAVRELRREWQPTLQPTALVHEAYLKLAGQRPKNWGR